MSKVSSKSAAESSSNDELELLELSAVARIAYEAAEGNNRDSWIAAVRAVLKAAPTLSSNGIAR